MNIVIKINKIENQLKIKIKKNKILYFRILLKFINFI